MMAGAGIIATIGTTSGWHLAFGGSALVLALFFAYHLRYLPLGEAAHLPLALLLPKPKTGGLLMLAIVAAPRFFAQYRPGRPDQLAFNHRTHSSRL